MTVEYSRLNVANQNSIKERAKTKKDGIYTFRGIDYRVYNKKPILYAVNNEIIQQFGSFNTRIGHYNSTDEKKRLMKNYDVKRLGGEV